MTYFANTLTQTNQQRQRNAPQASMPTTPRKETQATNRRPRQDDPEMEPARIQIRARNEPPRVALGRADTRHSVQTSRCTPRIRSIRRTVYADIAQNFQVSHICCSATLGPRCCAPTSGKGTSTEAKIRG